MSSRIRVAKTAEFATPYRRLEFAKFLSLIFTPGKPMEGVPHLVTPDDEYEYVLDALNNWKVIFDREDPRIFWLTFRYGSADPALEDAAHRFIAHVFGMCELLYRAGPQS